MSFQAISQYVGAHENFAVQADDVKLHFYALYKASSEPAPDHNFSTRLYLFCFRFVEYKKWMAWWLMSHTYNQKEAEGRYIALAKEIHAFPDPSLLEIMKSTSTSAGKGSSKLIIESTSNDATSPESSDQVMDDLIAACEKNNLDFVRKYIKDGGDVNLRTVEGTSILHFAVDSQCTEIVQLLISNGVDVSSTDDEGNTPLDAALINESIELTSILKAAGATTNSFQ